ncbi:hypothetical protein CBR_g6680 [Chara braunii]|uniref:Telomere-associated protein Rif1 N-terminal domain-containing protein n=1 Tax=Chara braunii TaxID=69332 RepID=A0A388KKH7_CHABU|nr:hypothetical protein CBR_g6680 [Chara braunii]|eukprot:GBG70554.1 hypothetical protein CBR_g6680 [Chara braunii]
MQEFSHLWCPPLYRRLLSEAKRERERAEECLEKARPQLLPPSKTLSSILAADVRSSLLMQLKSLVSKSPSQALGGVRAWSWIVLLLGSRLVDRSMLINEMLKIPEATMLSKNVSVRLGSQVAWKGLIDSLISANLVTNGGEPMSPATPVLPPCAAPSLDGCASPEKSFLMKGSPCNSLRPDTATHATPSVKRLRLLMIPLINSIDNDVDAAVRLAALRNWIYLVECLGSWVRTPPVFAVVASPMYEMIFRKGAQRGDKVVFGKVLACFEDLIVGRNQWACSTPPLQPLHEPCASPTNRENRSAIGLPPASPKLRAGEEAGLDVMGTPLSGKGGTEAGKSAMWDPAEISRILDLITVLMKTEGDELEGADQAKDVVPVWDSVRLFTLLLRRVEQEGKGSVRPTEEHVAAVKSVLHWTVSLVNGTHPSITLTWMIMEAMITELKSTVLASSFYRLPLTEGGLGLQKEADAGGGSGGENVPSMPAPDGGSNKPCDLPMGLGEPVTPLVYLAAVWLQRGIRLCRSDPMVRSWIADRVSQLMEAGSSGHDVSGNALACMKLLEWATNQVSQSCGEELGRSDVDFLLTVWVGFARNVRVALEKANEVGGGSASNGRGEGGSHLVHLSLLMPFRILSVALEGQTKQGDAPLQCSFAGKAEENEALDLVQNMWEQLFGVVYRVLSLKGGTQNEFAGVFFQKLLKLLGNGLGVVCMHESPPLSQKGSGLQEDNALENTHALKSCFIELLVSVVAKVLGQLEFSNVSVMTMFRKRRRGKGSFASTATTSPADVEDVRSIRELLMVTSRCLLFPFSPFCKGKEGARRREAIALRLFPALEAFIKELSTKQDVLILIQELCEPFVQWLSAGSVTSSDASVASPGPATATESSPGKAAASSLLSWEERSVQHRGAFLLPAKVMRSLQNAWSSFLSLLQSCRPSMSFDSTLLALMAPMLARALVHPFDPIANVTVCFWQTTFGGLTGGGSSSNGGGASGSTGGALVGNGGGVGAGSSRIMALLKGESHKGNIGRVGSSLTTGRGSGKLSVQGCLEYPSVLRPVLALLRQKTAISLPSWRESDSGGRGPASTPSSVVAGGRPGVVPRADSAPHDSGQSPLVTIGAAHPSAAYDEKAADRQNENAVEEHILQTNRGGQSAPQCIKHGESGVMEEGRTGQPEAQTRLAGPAASAFASLKTLDANNAFFEGRAVSSEAPKKISFTVVESDAGQRATASVVAESTSTVLQDGKKDENPRGCERGTVSPRIPISPINTGLKLQWSALKDSRGQADQGAGQKDSPALLRRKKKLRFWDESEEVEYVKVPSKSNEKPSGPLTERQKEVRDAQRGRGGLGGSLHGTGGVRTYTSVDYTQSLGMEDTQDGCDWEARIGAKEKEAMEKANTGGRECNTEGNAGVAVGRESGCGIQPLLVKERKSGPQEPLPDKSSVAKGEENAAASPAAIKGSAMETLLQQGEQEQQRELGAAAPTAIKRPAVETFSQQPHQQGGESGGGIQPFLVKNGEPGPQEPSPLNVSLPNKSSEAKGPAEEKPQQQQVQQQQQQHYQQGDKNSRTGLLIDRQGPGNKGLSLHSESPEPVVVKNAKTETVHCQANNNLTVEGGKPDNDSSASEQRSNFERMNAPHNTGTQAVESDRIEESDPRVLDAKKVDGSCNTHGRVSADGDRQSARVRAVRPESPEWSVFCDERTLSGKETRIVEEEMKEDDDVQHETDTVLTNHFAGSSKRVVLAQKRSGVDLLRESKRLRGMSGADPHSGGGPKSYADTEQNHDVCDQNQDVSDHTLIAFVDLCRGYGADAPVPVAKQNVEQDGSSLQGPSRQTVTEAVDRSGDDLPCPSNSGRKEGRREKDAAAPHSTCSVPTPQKHGTRSTSLQDGHSACEWKSEGRCSAVVDGCLTPGTDPEEEGLQLQESSLSPVVEATDLRPAGETQISVLVNKQTVGDAEAQSCSEQYAYQYRQGTAVETGGQKDMQGDDRIARNVTGIVEAVVPTTRGEVMNREARAVNLSLGKAGQNGVESSMDEVEVIRENDQGQHLPLAVVEREMVDCQKASPQTIRCMAGRKGYVDEKGKRHHPNIGTPQGLLSSMSVMPRGQPGGPKGGIVVGGEESEDEGGAQVLSRKTAGIKTVAKSFVEDSNGDEDEIDRDLTLLRRLSQAGQWDRMDLHSLIEAQECAARISMGVAGAMRAHLIRILSDK